MDVIATRKGFFGGRIRNVGDEFTLNNPAEFSKSWMASPGTPEYTNALAPAKDKPNVVSERLMAGGVAEQLAVALEELRAAQARIAELTAENRLLQERVGPKPVDSQTPASEDGAAEEEAPSKGAERRRRGPVPQPQE